MCNILKKKIKNKEKSSLEKLEFHTWRFYFLYWVGLIIDRFYALDRL